MKKVIAIVAIATLAACGGGAKSTNPTTDSTVVKADTTAKSTDTTVKSANKTESIVETVTK